MMEHLQGKQETIFFGEHSACNVYVGSGTESYQEHWHTPVEVIMPLQKGYQVCCAGQAYDLAEGDILIVAPGTLHSLHGGEEGSWLTVQMNLQMFHESGDITTLLSALGPVRILSREMTSEIYEEAYALLLRIKEETERRDAFCQMALIADALRFFCLVGRECTGHFQAEEERKEKQDQLERFRDICEYIRLHCTEQLSLEKAAAAAGFSKYHFARCFRRYTNTTYYKYLNTQRIMYASRLIMDPKIRVTDAAFSAGFNSITSFTRMFKEIQGCTPTEYRKLYTSAW